MDERNAIVTALRQLADDKPDEAGDTLAAALEPPTEEAREWTVDDAKRWGKSKFLFTPSDDPGDWKLPICDDSGEVTLAKLGAAAAALSAGGFRGRQAQMPPEAKRAAAKRLIGLYKEHGGEPPEHLYKTAGMSAPKKEALEVHEAAKVGKQLEGKVWEVVLIQAGASKNGVYYPPEVLKQYAHLFEGVKCYDSHLTDDEFKRNPSRKVGELLGWFESARWSEENQAIVANFHAAAQWLREMLLNAWEDGNPALFGFSIDAMVYWDERDVEGKQLKYVTGIAAIRSVDAVCEPAAGGRVLRVLASVDASPKEKGHMDDIFEKLKTLPDEEKKKALDILKPAAPVKEQDASFSAALLAEKLWNLELRDILRESGLPREAQKFVEAFYQDMPDAGMDKVKAAIEQQRTVLATSVDNAVKGLGPVQPTVVAAPVFGVQEGQASLARMLGIASPDELKFLKDRKVGRMTLSQWYTTFTGDDEYIGVVAPHRVTEANVTTTTANSVVANVLNKYLEREITALEAKRWWNPVVGEYDDETINQVAVVGQGGLAAIRSMSEGQTYQELTYADKEETGTYTKYGDFLGVTMEAVMRDNLDALRRVPQLLAKSWIYALSDLVSAVFTSAAGVGPTLTETSRALFNTTEANLGTTALSYAAYVAARQAMMKLTEYTSSRRLGIVPRFCLVPIDLEATALQIRNSELDPDNADNGVNTVRNSFEVIVVPQWTDTNNWYLMASPADCEVIRLHYFRGRRNPELFTASDETQGALFTNDTYRFKVRMWVARVVADWRGAYGNVV